MVYIIAEAGVNHNGSLELAYELIDIAVEAKADAIKFQTFNSEKLALGTAEKAEYQKETTGEKESQLDMLKKLELSYDEFGLISKRCDEMGIEFISTPFDLDSVDFLDELGVTTFKVGSGDLTNFLLLKKIAEKNKKIILSTGMSSMDEVKKSVNFIKKHSSNELVVLHCVSCYPTNKEDLNLNCIKTLKNELNIPIGFSDHTKDEIASLYSVCVGATYIEKHFTINKNMEGPDHRASLNPEELNNFVEKIRECEIILGNGNKNCTKNEEKNKKVVRRSLFFSKDLKKGDIITENDLIALRPYNGICVSKFGEILGKELIQDVKMNSYVKYISFKQ
jgi:N,N'-diacetyllegionaminate synthase